MHAFHLNGNCVDTAIDSYHQMIKSLIFSYDTKQHSINVNDVMVCRNAKKNSHSAFSLETTENRIIAI